MKHMTFAGILLAGLLAATGCKKDTKAADPATGSGSATMTTGSGSATTTTTTTTTTPAGSGDMAGSAVTTTDTAGSGSAATTTTTTTTGAGAAMTDAEVEGMIKQMVAMFQDISTAVDGKDCKAAAAGITAALDKNQAFIDKMKPLAKDKALEDRAEKIMEEKGYEKQLDEASKGIGPAAQKCGNDADFMKAMERLGSAME